MCKALRMEKDLLEDRVAQRTEALRKSERRLHRAEVVARLGSWELNLAGKEMKASAGAAIIYGLEGNRWALSDVQKAPLPEYRGMLDEALRALLEEGKPYNVEFRIRRQTDGKIIDIHSMAEYSEERGILFGVIHDITDRKLAEAVANSRKETLAKIFESAPYVMMLVDDDVCVTDINHSGISLSGKPKQEILGLLGGQAFDCINSCDGLGCGRTVFCGNCLIRSSVIHTFSTGDSIYDLEGNITLRKDDKDVVANILISTILVKDNASDKVLVTIVDITERKHMEEALRESEERLRTLINSTPDAVCFKDGEGRWLEANDADLELFELTGVDYKGKKDSELAEYSEFYREAFLACEESDERAWKEYGLTRIEETIPRPDGTERIYDVIKIPLYHWDGKRKGLTVLGRDITERRKAEEEKARSEARLRETQKIEAIGTLAGGIAHDFNNILAPIMGYTEMVLSELEEGSHLRSDLEQVLSATNRAKKLVGQILAFSRQGQSGQVMPTDIGQVTNEALKLMRASLPATIEIRQNIQKGIALADPTQIHQVVVNLCTNAAHAMEGKGNLDVALVRTELGADDLAERPVPDLAPGPYLKLSVADNGHGMDAKTLEHLFEPYFTTKAVGKGTGLGLAVVHGIVKRFNGGIVVWSNPGTGSVFDVYLPVAEELPKVTTDSTQSLPLGTERILLLDDEATITNLEAKMLRRLGYHVTAKTDASEALAVFLADPYAFDLILTDFTMPHMTGIDLAGEIFKTRPDIPIILCTGFSEKETIDLAHEIGVKEYVMKPLNKQELAEVVRKVLDAEID